MEYILHYVDETSTARQAIIHSSPQILSYAIETEFDFCDLCDLENQGHIPKTNRLSHRPMEKLDTEFQIDCCKTF